MLYLIKELHLLRKETEFDFKNLSPFTAGITWNADLKIPLELNEELCLR